MFNKDSGLVQIWVRLIAEKVYKKTLIPKISNLREIVLSVLDEKQGG